MKCEVKNEMEFDEKNEVKSGMSGAAGAGGEMYGGWRQMPRIQAPQTRRDLNFLGGDTLLHGFSAE